MSTNPYTPPSTISEPQFSGDSTDEPLAGRFTRFAAAMVDGILILIIVLAVQFLTGFVQRTAMQQASILEQMVMSLLGIAVMLLLNGYLLVSRGQTIGKMLTNIQIVDFDTGKLLPFVRVYVYRYLWTLPFFLTAVLIPGTRDDALINLVVLIDALFIFSELRRCLHDRIAGSKVVLYRAGRERLS